MNKLDELESKIDIEVLRENLESKIRKDDFTEDEYYFCTEVFNMFRIFGDKRLTLTRWSFHDDKEELRRERNIFLNEKSKIIQENFKLIEEYLLMRKDLLIYFGVCDFWRIYDYQIENHIIIHLGKYEIYNKDELFKNETFKDCVDYLLILMYRDYEKDKLKDETFVEYMEKIKGNLLASNKKQEKFYGYGSKVNSFKREIFNDY